MAASGDGDAQPLLIEQGTLDSLTWAPDGKRLAFVRRSDCERRGRKRRRATAFPATADEAAAKPRDDKYEELSHIYSVIGATCNGR